MPYVDRRFSRTKLRQYRLAAGLELDDVARAVFRTERTVLAYEKGEVVPPTDALPLLAGVLGIPVDDLFEELAETTTGAR